MALEPRHAVGHGGAGNGLADAGDADRTTAPTAFTASGFAFTTDIVAGVMQRLELVPALSDVTLQSSTRAKVGTRNVYQFTLSANVLPEVPQQ